jgi:hypothetical protein
MLASSYGFLSGAWPFGAVEAIWSVVALRRFWSSRHAAEPAGQPVQQSHTGI